MPVRGKKFALCTNCGKSTGSQKLDSNICPSCKKPTMQMFDSQSESRRFLTLKENSDILYLRTQVVFYLKTPVYDYKESWSAKFPEESKVIGEKIFASYKADFVYFDQNNIRGWVVEDFKPTFIKPKSKKLYPKIDEYANIKLKCLALKSNNAFDVYASYEDISQIGGYGMKKIIPNKINASGDHVHI